MKLTIALVALVAAPLSSHAQISYQQPSYFHSSGAAPVVVPPTVINASSPGPNDSKKSCKESMIDLFIFSIRRTTGDCTP
jgi:hypothetical protein